MSRPTMAGRKLTVDTNQSLEPSDNLGKSSPTLAKLNSAPTNTNSPIGGKVPLGVIPSSTPEREKEEVASKRRDDDTASSMGKDDLLGSPSKLSLRAVPGNGSVDSNSISSKGGSNLSTAQRPQQQMRGEEEGKEADLDFTERRSAKQLNASVAQRVGKAFFQSLILKTETELASYPVEDALGRAILAHEQIDVEMILDEMGAEASNAIASRDRFGRTKLHIAALVDSPQIITILLENFRRQTQRQLEEETLKLDNDRFKVLGELEKAVQFDLPGGVAKHPRVVAVKEWFQKELERKRRQAEIRIEVWWARLLSTKDTSGRTCLHYAVSRDAPVAVLKALLTSGRCHLNPSHALFQKSVVYDCASGLEIVNFGSSDEFDVTAQPKKEGAGAKNNSTYGVRNIAWELGSTLGLKVSLPTAESAAAESFEVVLPWVLRNVVRRAAERGDRSDDSSGLRAFERLVKATVAQPSSVLLVPELRALLASLGIRVTKEVLREMCRRYPADVDEVRNKWVKVEKEQREEARDIRTAAALLDRRHNTGGSKDGQLGDGNNDDSSRADEKPSRGGGGCRSSKYEEQDDSKEPSADAKGASSGRRLEGDALSETDIAMLRRRRALKDREDKLLQMDDLDSERGVDFHLLFADMKDGRGLQSLDIREGTVTTTSALEQGIANVVGKDESKRHELEELLLEGGKQSCPKSGADAERAMNHDAPPGYPSCVSVSSINRARRAIVNICDDYGRSPLLIASALGLNSIVSCLLSQGGDVSLSTPEGHSPLSVANGTSTRTLLERALVSWLNQREGGGGTSTKRLVEIKRDDCFLDSLRLAPSASPSNTRLKSQATDAIVRSDKSRLDERASVVLGLTSQLTQLSAAGWSYSRAPLSWAVNNGLLVVVKQLLREGTSPNIRDAVNRTPIHECCALIAETSSTAILEAAIQVAEALVEAGGDVNAASISGRTPLHELFCRSQDESASSFTSVPNGHKKALFHVLSNASSPQHVGHYRRLLLKLLLEFGADVTLLDRQGLAAIHYCVRSNDAGCVLEMLRRNCDPGALTARKQTCLHIACKAGARDVINLLCRWDADSRPGRGLLHKRDAQGKLAAALLPSSITQAATETLWGACRQGNASKVQNLLAKMKMAGGDALWEDVDATEQDRAISQDSSISSTEEFNRVASPQELWLLNGVDAKSRRMRWTPLHACIVGWAESEASRGKPNLCARRALELPVGGTTSVSADPSSPPRVSFGSGLYPETLALLLKNHAFVDAIDTHGRTPLMLACACNLSSAVDLLVAADADIEQNDLDNRRALHFAYVYGAVSCISKLEHLGARTYAREESPLTLAGRSDLISNSLF